MAKIGTPSHVGFIPDGNRRWATDHGLPKEAGYVYQSGMQLYEQCKEFGIKEASIYCFTQDNTKRPSVQKPAFSEACVAFALEIARRGAAVLVVGDETSTQFPTVLEEFRKRQGNGMKEALKRRPSVGRSFTTGPDCAMGRGAPVERFLACNRYMRICMLGMNIGLILLRNILTTRSPGSRSKIRHSAVDRSAKYPALAGAKWNRCVVLENSYAES